MIFAVDFDGTIVENLTNGNKLVELPHAIEVLKALQKANHKIIIWTCREGPMLQYALHFFLENKFVPDAVNKNILEFPNSGIAQHKIYADVYIDDRSFPAFTSWRHVERVFLKGIFDE
jgi:hydroxymethylpyrimidine pyrophosphatase-like HAD family hydrolase